MMLHWIGVLLLLAFTAALWVSWYIPREARNDYARIILDGPNNTLGKDFHRRGFLRRFGVGVLLSLPFVYFHWLIALSALFTLGCLFYSRFDRTLNLLRGLPEDYVGKTSAIDKWYRKRYGNTHHRKMRGHKNLLLILSHVLLFITVFSTAPH